MTEKERDARERGRNGERLKERESGRNKGVLMEGELD